MEKIKFKRLLFDIACSAVACDGHIDDREIRELQYIDKSTIHFEDIDLSKKLNRFVNNFNYDPDETISIIIEKLKFELLNPVEEMLVLEIVLRLVYADAKIDEKEIEFIKSVRSCLSLDDEMITQRFGAIDFLINAEIINISSQEKSTKKMNSIDMTSLENMYSKLDGKE